MLTRNNNNIKDMDVSQDLLHRKESRKGTRGERRRKTGICETPKNAREDEVKYQILGF